MNSRIHVRSTLSRGFGPVPSKVHEEFVFKHDVAMNQLVYIAHSDGVPDIYPDKSEDVYGPLSQLHRKCYHAFIDRVNQMVASDFANTDDLFCRESVLLARKMSMALDNNNWKWAVTSNLNAQSVSRLVNILCSEEYFGAFFKWYVNSIALDDIPFCSLHVDIYPRDGLQCIQMSYRGQAPFCVPFILITSDLPTNPIYAISLTRLLGLLLPSPSCTRQFILSQHCVWPVAMALAVINSCYIEAVRVNQTRREIIRFWLSDKMHVDIYDVADVYS